MEPKPTQSQVQVGAWETVDRFLLPEQVSLPSLAKGPREILVLDSGSEKSDWSELEGH